MSVFDEYSEFFSIIWYTDENGKKVSIQRNNEQHKIVNNKILLLNVPDNFYKVTIAGKTEIKINLVITGAEFYKVNYLTGEVYFHSSLEGQTITITQYYGRGLIRTMAQRIELIDENNLYVAENVEDFATEITQRVDNLVTNAGDGNSEIVDSRTSAPTETIYTTLKNRLDTEYQDTIDKIGTLTNLTTNIKTDLVTAINMTKYFFNVKDYGAVGDGITDDTDSIVATIASGAKLIYIPKGTYKIRPNEIILGSGQILYGAGMAASSLYVPGLISTGVILNGVRSGIEGLQIYGDGTATSGYGLYIKSSGIKVNDVYIRDVYTGIFIEGNPSATIIYINQLLIESVNHTGLKLKDVNDVFLNQFIITTDSVTPSFGIRLENRVEAFSATNGDVLNFAYSLSTDATVNGPGTRPAYNKFTNVYFDSSANGVLIDKSVATKFTSCWFSNRPGRGCVIYNSTDIEFSACDFVNNGADGLLIESTSKHVRVHGGSVQNNNYENVNANGILVAANTTDFIIQGVSIGNSLGFTGQQQRGVLVNTGSSDRYVIADNLVNGNVVAGVVDNGSGTNKRVENNY